MVILTSMNAKLLKNWHNCSKMENSMVEICYKLYKQLALEKMETSIIWKPKSYGL